MAIALALAAAVLFALLTIAIRIGQRQVSDTEAGAGAVMAIACVPIAVAALVADFHRLSIDELWPYLAAGAVVPGLTQPLIQWAIREAGVSRPMVVLGASPLASVAVAVALLGESLGVATVAGTVLVVLGTVALAAERERPEHVRIAGLLAAGMCAATFAVRDNVVRAASRHYDPPPLAAGAASLVAGAAVGFALVLLVHRGSGVAQVRRALRPMLPAGLCLTGAYSSLIAAFSFGPVTTVVPLNATQSLWTVIAASIFMSRSERVGRRLLVAALLVVAGGALIGATR